MHRPIRAYNAGRDLSICLDIISKKKSAAVRFIDFANELYSCSDLAVGKFLVAESNAYCRLLIRWAGRAPDSILLPLKIIGSLNSNSPVIATHWYGIRPPQLQSEIFNFEFILSPFHPEMSNVVEVVPALILLNLARPYSPSPSAHRGSTHTRASRAVSTYAASGPQVPAG